MDSPLGQRLRELPGPVMLTGHTGFKGTWMTFLLEHLNVPVVGYSLHAEDDSLFKRTDRMGVIPEQFSDIRNQDALARFIDLHKPSTIIHMAAQPLVLASYESPRETFDVNVMGTVNVLDIAFTKEFVKAIIIATTDKVYRNDNSGREFVESDPLEGKDPYSASKVGTEAVIAAWQQIERVSGGPKVISVRAGNVIGGGDFAENRIIPDLIRGAISGKNVEIRNPNSTRPWQHVLDPLVGYIMLMEKVLTGKFIDSLNFGPQAVGISVKEITEIGKRYFPKLENQIQLTSPVLDDLEASQLQINSWKSYQYLGWEAKWLPKKAIELTFQWWKSELNEEFNPFMLCKMDIERYLSDSDL